MLGDCRDVRGSLYWHRRLLRAVLHTAARDRKTHSARSIS